jgi:hypothetical protein
LRSINSLNEVNEEGEILKEINLVSNSSRRGNSLKEINKERESLKYMEKIN